MPSAAAGPQAQPAARRTSLAAFESPGGVTTSAQQPQRPPSSRARVLTEKGDSYARSQAESEGGGNDDDTATGEAHTGSRTNPDRSVTGGTRGRWRCLNLKPPPAAMTSAVSFVRRWTEAQEREERALQVVHG